MSLSEPTKMFSDLITEQRIIDEGNPVTTLHVSNLRITTDAGDNIKPIKGDREPK